MAHDRSPTIEPRLYINNQYLTAKSDKTIPVNNPFDDSHIGDVQCAGPADIEDAVSAAEAGLKGEWSTFTAPQRAKCLFKLADLMEAKGAELAKLDTFAMGTPISVLTYGLVPASVAALRYFAGWADKIPGESYKDDQNGFYTVRDFCSSLLLCLSSTLNLSIFSPGACRLLQLGRFRPLSSLIISFATYAPLATGLEAVLAALDFEPRK